MTVSEAAVKILSPLGVALLGYMLKHISKFQLFTTFRRLSSSDRSELFSLLHKSNSGFIDDFKIQSQMLVYGIRYTPQFMKNLFYYARNQNIRADNKDLSAFLSLPGLFICEDDGEVRLKKGVRFISGFVFFSSLLLMVFVINLILQSVQDININLKQHDYSSLWSQAALVMVCIPYGFLSLLCIYTVIFRSIPAFRFARIYRKAWDRRDLFEKGEQNLYCRNKTIW